MNAFIGFIMGPMVWISALIFVLGLVFKFIKIYTGIKEKENFVFTYMTWPHSLRSIGAWLIPFFPQSTRIQPVFWGITYCFHILLFLVPLFLSAHIVLFDEAFQVSWPALNDGLADILTLAVILALVFLAVRRMVVPEVKFLTSIKDYILLVIVLLPFLTGFIAYHQAFSYQWMVIVHVLSGELMLIAIPFSRFSHMLTAPLTRAFTGSEFGNVRHARDW
ncbi:TmcC family electron transfer complex membrane anchor subunit [Desulfospira joergensenii]|uniref:TmcC family electron transfer complex membrane anchor subunit n=1 Tax=Desulfospira joergensenii TaxID=53329 RepID=UPI0003B34EC7|nr:Tmc redox complex membrane protein TmcC [Desulfospira joergensenii]